MYSYCHLQWKTSHIFTTQFSIWKRIEGYLEAHLQIFHSQMHAKHVQGSSLEVQIQCHGNHAETYIFTWQKYSG